MFQTEALVLHTFHGPTFHVLQADNPFEYARRAVSTDASILREGNYLGEHTSQCIAYAYQSTKTITFNQSMKQRRTINQIGQLVSWFPLFPQLASYQNTYRNAFFLP